MRVIVTSAIVVINFILQSTLYQHIEIFGVRPNTGLIIVISFAILRLDVEGAIIGFFNGLLYDIMFGRTIGIHALLGMIVGYICGKPFKDFYSENYLLPFFLVIGSSLLYEYAFYISSFLFRNRLDIFYYSRKIIIPVVAYNALLTLPLYRVIYGINNWIDENEKHKRKLF